MSDKIKIVVVGGGSAGWITASYLKNSINCDLTVIHEETNNPIGVGETVTPTIRLIAEKAGIPEEIWMRDSNATFKYGIKFNDWKEKGSVWYHLFEDAFEYDGIDSVEYLLENYNVDSKTYNLYHGPQQYLLEENKSPYPNLISDRPGYAYQIMADKFGKTLKKYLNDYTLIESSVSDVVIKDNQIDHIILKNGQKIFGDVFFDCTGFKRILISKFSKYKKYDDMICNKFIAGTVDKKIDKHKVYTELTAVKDGWIWDVNTYQRTASGFIYSDKFTDDQTAKQIFIDYWKNERVNIVFDCVEFYNGSMENIAVNNCISNGLSQSFIEPMEATSLMLTCYTVQTFVDIYNKKNNWDSKESTILDKQMRRYLNHSKEFVKYHYTLSDRRDSEFWKYWNEQQDVKSYNDYLELFLNKKRYCKKGETLFNHFNLGSMLIGYGKKYQKQKKFNKLYEKKYKEYENNMGHDSYLNSIR